MTNPLQSGQPNNPTFNNMEPSTKPHTITHRTTEAGGNRTSTKKNRLAQSSTPRPRITSHTPDAQKTNKDKKRGRGSTGTGTGLTRKTWTRTAPPSQQWSTFAHGTTSTLADMANNHKLQLRARALQRVVGLASFGNFRGFSYDCRYGIYNLDHRSLWNRQQRPSPENRLLRKLEPRLGFIRVPLSGVNLYATKVRDAALLQDQSLIIKKKLKKMHRWLNFLFDPTPKSLNYILGHLLNS